MRLDKARASAALARRRIVVRGCGERAPRPDVAAKNSSSASSCVHGCRTLNKIPSLEGQLLGNAHLVCQPTSRLSRARRWLVPTCHTATTSRLSCILWLPGDDNRTQRCRISGGCLDLAPVYNLPLRLPESLGGCDCVRTLASGVGAHCTTSLPIMPLESPCIWFRGGLLRRVWCATRDVRPHKTVGHSAKGIVNA